MGLTWTDAETAGAWVRQVRDLTDGPFQVNFALHFPPHALHAVLEAGAPMLTFSWGDPEPHVPLVRQYGVRFGIQVVSAEGALLAMRHRPDFLVCQGIEAGGHVQSTTPLRTALAQVLEIAGETPVIGAGGLSIKEHIQDVIGLGATGAMLGTRFVATQESRAHPIYKQNLVEQSATSLTCCFDGGWPYSPHRVLRNSTLEAWESAGSPPSPIRPGEGNLTATRGEVEYFRYEVSAPSFEMEGDIEAMCLYAGESVAHIHDIPTVAELMGRLGG